MKNLARIVWFLIYAPCVPQRPTKAPKRSKTFICPALKILCEIFREGFQVGRRVPLQAPWRTPSMAEREPPAGTGGFLVLVLESVSVDPHRSVAALRQLPRRPSAGTGARCGMAGAIDPNGHSRFTLGTAGRDGVFPHGVGVSLPRRAYGQSSRPDLEVRVFDRSIRGGSWP